MSPQVPVRRPVHVRPHARRHIVHDPRYTRRVPPPSDRDLLSSRITELRESLRRRVGAYGAQKGEPLSEDQIRNLEKTSEITFDEHFKFQDTQAWAHVSGIISTSEAQIVYVALGETGSVKNGGWASDTDLATKIIVTQLMFELMMIKTKTRKGQEGDRRYA